ncbi:MAG: hypothetical protein ACD_36C00159G0002 [uncultured bacterium]|nr:MAG: hypothetical protein ACD_36C00159G0002 [uncultured bacterium]
MGDTFTTKHVNDAMNKGVAEARPKATTDDLQRAIPTRDALRYVKNDTYVADVSSILGRVYYEKIGNDALVPFFISIAAAVDPNTKLSTPQTVSELIVDSKIKGNAEALSFLSVDLNAEELLEVRVINNATARVVDKGDEWEKAIEKWLNNPQCQKLINNPTVGTISIVTGAVQKYFTTKKYKKFEAGAKGGGWGVNVEGSLYTSTSQFDLSVIYGLDLVTFKQVEDVNEFVENIARKNIVKEPAALAAVRKKFDRMAMSRPSLFRIADRPDF